MSQEDQLSRLNTQLDRLLQADGLEAFDVLEEPKVLLARGLATGPGREATQAALVNYGLIANEVVTTDDIVERLREAARVPTSQT